MKRMIELLAVVSVSMGSLVPVYAMEPQVGDVIELELVPFPFSFEWLVHHKPGEVCSGLCLHQTTIQWMLSLYCA
ncbi:hypothetical protein BOO30_19435 [Vibrio navarrensis]|uniref:hypothetical protein n=1 Tax=Vibrio navarrensis TaxID=29495 RepID=UPI00186A92D0|nr:hypothetical protein [Vibrio navarrensis]MBE4579711.1 hypothetical protein [Vibrio navarrensis]MBE4598518.1 hypothetical protein [Vibrio navarrensis]